MIRECVGQYIPELETTLANQAFSNNGDIDPGLTLYMANCGIATTALRRILDKKHGIKTERLLTRLANPSPEPHKGINHVILRHGDTVIDPTPNQFFKTVGLTPERARDENLRHLYPDEKAWVVNIDELPQRAAKFAKDAYDIDHQGLVPRPLERELGLYGIGVLRDRSLEDMDTFFQKLWDINEYKPFNSRM